MLQKIKQVIYDFFLYFGIQIKIVRKENFIWLQKRNIEAVLDIGANTGQFATRIHEILPKAKIFSFEPIKSCYDALLLNVTKQHLPVSSFHYALGEKEETIEINISEHSPSSSLLDTSEFCLEVLPATRYVSTENITVRRLDDIASTLHLPSVFMIKIDVQGFEDRVIKGGVETFKKADVILIETSFRELYREQLLFDDIHALLISLGFRFGGNLSQTRHPEDGSFIYADSIFFNNHNTMR